MRDKPLPKNKKQKRLDKAKKRPVVLGKYLIVCEGEKTEPNYFKWYKEEPLFSKIGFLKLRVFRVLQEPLLI